MTRFHHTWPYADAAAVLTAWQSWAPSAPRRLSASLLLTVPADPNQPPAATVFGAMSAESAEAAEELSDLVARIGREPASNALAHASHRETKRQLAAGGDDDTAGHAYHKSEFFSRPLPAAAVTALVDHLIASRRPGEARELDFTPWGGAYNDLAVDATAFPHRSERFLLKHQVVLEADAAPETAQTAREWLEQSCRRSQPWGSGGVYPNFPDPDLTDPARAYYGVNLPRLQGIRATYDPHHLLGRPGEGHVPRRGLSRPELRQSVRRG